MSVTRTRRAGRTILLVLWAALLTACGNPALKVLYGNFRFSQGDYTQATISYMRALAADEDSAVIGYNLANVYYALGETGPAVDALEDAAGGGDWKAVRFRAYYNLGNVYFDLGEFDRAVTSYIEALKVDPEDRDAKVNLELALRRQGSEMARRELEKQSGVENALKPLEERHREILETVRKQERRESWKDPEDDQLGDIGW